MSELQKIEEIIENAIRPALRMHGGDMQIVSFENNVLKIQYQGACGGCPGATMSTRIMIQEVLQQEVSSQITVEIA